MGHLSRSLLAAGALVLATAATAAVGSWSPLGPDGESISALAADPANPNLVEWLAFGLETVDPARARFLVKSLNGRAYVEQARETIARTAEAGIYPVLFLIMADPRSTPLEIVREVSDVIDLMSYVYRRTLAVRLPQSFAVAAEGLAVN